MKLLTSTNDKTDRTAEVAELLAKEGSCRLGEGDFYIHDLVMPEKTAIFGCGNTTRVILDESVQDGFIFRMQTLCTLKDMMLVGSETEIELSETVGTRHGIVWYGNYNKDRTDFPCRGTVSGIHAHGFSGGALTQSNTGYATESGLNVSDCCFWNCCVGINIAYWSEFNRYTNINSGRNYYGVINNGGNNTFVNCSFSSNKLGMLMDNSQGQSPNNSHGGVVGCMFDHSDSNRGVGIRILSMKVGEVFDACQLFYSKIEVENSEGITFNNFNCGRNEGITVKGGGLVTFNHCTFSTTPHITIRDNENVFFHDCRTRSGAVVDKPVIDPSVRPDWDPALLKWEGYIKPFRIFGNLYFIGTVPASTHLIDTGDGLIIIDPGYPFHLALVLHNLEELGFRAEDIKLIINTHGHYDHCGATKVLQQLSGATTAVGRLDADYVNGKVDLTWARELGHIYNTPFEADILLDNNRKLTIGNTEILCKSAPGHTPGTMAFFFNVTDGEKTYRAAMHGGIGDNTMRIEWLKKNGLSTETREQFIPAVMKFIDEPVDITLGNHCHNNDTVGKASRMTEKENPFIDPTEWKRMLTDRIESLQRIWAEEQA